MHAYKWTETEMMGCPLAKAFCYTHAIAAREGRSIPGPTLREIEILKSLEGVTP